MKIHYVYAHPTEQSFNKELLTIAKSSIDENQLTVSDLYQMQFNPAATTEELSSAVDKQVIAEVEKIKQADLVILQFPLWWFSVPAILKGWMDKVFVPGIAYSKEMKFQNGGFASKKALIVTTTQAPKESYTEAGLNGPIESILQPIHHALHFVGFETLAPFIGYRALGNTTDENKVILDQYQAYLTNILGNKNG